MTYTAKQLAQFAMQQVRWDLTIGEGNTRKGYTRTAGWSDEMLHRMRNRGYFYQAVYTQNGISWTRVIDYSKAPMPHPGSTERQRIIDQKHLVRLTESLAYKAGNCSEMAELAALRLSEMVLNHLTPEDDFEIQVISLPGVDHVLTRIRLGNEIAICDPWIHFADNINLVNMTEYLARLYETLNRKQKKIFQRFERLVLLSIQHGISHSKEAYRFNTIESFNEAFELVSSHQLYHDAYMRRWYADDPTLIPGHLIAPPRNPSLHQQVLREVKDQNHVAQCMTYWRDARAAHERCVALIHDMINQLDDENTDYSTRHKPCLS